MKRLLVVLLVVVLLAQVASAFAAPNMEPNGKGNGHTKGLESHDKDWKGNAYGHVKFGCDCHIEEPINE